MQNEEILIRALDQYSKPSGMVNWKRAFQENPTWKRTLLAGGATMQAAVYTPINQLKWKRRRAKETLSLIGVPTTPPPAPDTTSLMTGAQALEMAQATPAAPARATTEEVMKIVDQAAIDYRVGKRIQWKRALAEHPEWPAQLHSQTSRNHYLKTLRQRHSYARKQARAASNGAPAAIPAPALRYCPHCGGALEAIQIAMSAVQDIL